MLIAYLCDIINVTDIALVVFYWQLSMILNKVSTSQFVLTSTATALP